MLRAWRTTGFNWFTDVFKIYGPIFQNILVPTIQEWAKLEKEDANLYETVEHFNNEHKLVLRDFSRL